MKYLKGGLGYKSVPKLRTSHTVLFTPPSEYGKSANIAKCCDSARLTGQARRTLIREACKKPPSNLGATDIMRSAGKVCTTMSQTSHKCLFLFFIFVWNTIKKKLFLQRKSHKVISSLPPVMQEEEQTCVGRCLGQIETSIEPHSSLG